MAVKYWFEVTYEHTVRASGVELDDCIDSLPEGARVTRIEQREPMSFGEGFVALTSAFPTIPEADFDHRHPIESDDAWFDEPRDV
jgi:hypothetical protein